MPPRLAADLLPERKKFEVHPVSENAYVPDTLDGVAQRVVDLLRDDDAADALPRRGEVLLDPPHVAQDLPDRRVAAPAALEFHYDEVAGTLIDAEEVDRPRARRELPAALIFGLVEREIRAEVDPPPVTLDELFEVCFERELTCVDRRVFGYRRG